MAPARARASPGGTVSPVTPSSETSGTPEGRQVFTTGTPHASASSCTIPNASLRAIDGSTNTEAATVRAQRVVRDLSGEGHLAGQPEPFRAVVEGVEQRALADEHQPSVHILHGVDEYVETLVVDEPPCCEHHSSAEPRAHGGHLRVIRPVEALERNSVRDDAAARGER